VVTTIERIAAIGGTCIIVVAINLVENTAKKRIATIGGAYRRIDTIYAHVHARLANNAGISGAFVPIVAFQVSRATNFILHILKHTRAIAFITTVDGTGTRIITDFRRIAATQKSMALILSAQ